MSSIRKLLSAVTLICILSLIQVSPALAGRNDFKLPFPCGETWIGSTYADHNLAIDFNWAGGEDRGKPVLASASGQAYWWVDEFGGNVVEIKHPDGWITVYAHLQTVNSGIPKHAMYVRPGATLAVSQGQQLGTVGDTGKAFGAHLHFEERSAVNVHEPIYFDGVAAGVGIGVSKSIVSTNLCTPPPPSEPNVVSPGEANFTKGGADSGWTPVVNGGNSGRAIYTYVNNTGRDNYARWTFDLGKLSGSGIYKIETYIPTTNAGTTNARYQINTTSGIQIATINQRQVNGWQNLGNFNLAAGSAWVELDDYTGEPTVIDQNHQIAFDSMRLTFVEAPKHTISATAGSNGSISPSGNSQVANGGSLTYSIAAQNGFHIDRLVVDGNSVAVAKTYTFNNVTGNHSLSVTFAPDQVSTTVSISLPGRGKQGVKFSLSGKVSPSVSAGKVQLVWKYKINGKYIDVETTSVALSQGKFNLSKVLKQKGAWQVTAKYLGSGTGPIYRASNTALDGIIIY